MRQIGLDADAVFDHPDIVVWRSIPDRENCTLDATLADGRPIRLHVKRYRPVRGTVTPGRGGGGRHPIASSRGHPHGAAGRLGQAGRRAGVSSSSKTWPDTAPADKLIAAGTPFDSLLDRRPTWPRDCTRPACTTATYTCAISSPRWTTGRVADLSLIDAARVRRLPGWPTRRRWIVKDLAQFWYST